MGYLVRMKEILDDLEDQPADRARFSIYVSKKIYDEFSKLTGRKRSRALERLMKLFIKTVKK
jgi:hypothetical protein